MLHRDVFRRQVVRRRVTRLEHAVPACRVRDRHAVEDDSQPSSRALERGWPWIVPDGLLPRAGLDALRFHHGSMAPMSSRANPGDEAQLAAYADALAAAV